MAVLAAPEIDFAGTDEPLSQGIVVAAADIMVGGAPAILTAAALVFPRPEQLHDEAGGGGGPGVASHPIG